MVGGRLARACRARRNLLRMLRARCPVPLASRVDVEGVDAGWMLVRPSALTQGLSYTRRRVGGQVGKQNTGSRGLI